MKVVAAIFAVLALAFVACDQAEEAGVEAPDVPQEAEVTDEQIVDGVRTLCEQLPLRDLAESFGVEVTDEQAVAEQVAEPFPEDVRENVEEGCLEGLEAAAAGSGTEGSGTEGSGTGTEGSGTEGSGTEGSGTES